MGEKDASDRDRRRALARFRQLVGRALVELRLASDIALAEGYGPELMRPVELARGTLGGCLSAAKRVRSE